MRFTKFILVGAIICMTASDVIAKPFLNPFNTAIQTKPNDDGSQKISFIYPKKSSELSVSFKTEEINKNMINFASLLSSIASEFFKKFGSLSNSFGGKSSVTTTTDASFDFDKDDDDSSSSSFSSSNGDSSSDSDATSSKDGYDSLTLTKDGEYSSSSGDKDDSRNGYDYSTPSATKASYDYPKPTTDSSYLPPVSEEIRYIPPALRPDTDYLPPL